MVSSDNVSITSSLSVAMVTTQTTLNNTVISCTDGTSLNGDTQEIMATVLSELCMHAVYIYSYYNLCIKKVNSYSHSYTASL